MVLPSKKTLSVRRNQCFGSCNVGIQEQYIKDSVATANDVLMECDKYIILALDEMSIKEELVYRSSSNDIIGCVDFDNDVYNQISKSGDN